MLATSYSGWLVATSIATAIADAYVGYTVIGRAAKSVGLTRAIWLVLGAVAMGMGAWTTHFVALSAFELGGPIGFELAPTLLSILPIVVAATIALAQTSRPRVSHLRTISAALALALGVTAMHYIGVSALRVEPGVTWNLGIVAASIAFAIAGAAASLYVCTSIYGEARRGRRIVLRWIAAGLFGAAVAGTHSLGMSAAHFADGSVCLSADAMLHGEWLGALVIAAALASLLAIWTAATLHRRMELRAEQLDAALERARNALAFQAYHDALTGLPNRAYVMDQLRASLGDAHASYQQVAVLFIDLDGFKAINDSLGHEAGDEFLRSVANALRASVRERDTVARFGGDEFVVVLERFRGADNLIAICHKILSLVSQPVMVHGHAVTVSPSIGVAVSPNDGHDAETLLRNADAAMYAVKEVGKGDFRFFERSMHTLARERLTMTLELREALQRGQISVHYQAKWDLRSGELAGVEALARWDHPERGAIAPTVFVPIAERSGLVSILGDHVLRSVLDQIERWQDDNFEFGYVAINLSLQELRNPSFVETLQAIVTARGVDPARLRFEITESTAMRDAESTLEQLRQLRSCGFALSIDDFGTGYSSLSHLRQLPIKTIKIDQSFVRGSMENREDREITEAIVALAKKLRLETVAEGVESEAQASWLREIGCDLAQGFFFAHPMPADALVRRLRANRLGFAPNALAPAISFL